MRGRGGIRELLRGDLDEKVLILFAAPHEREGGSVRQCGEAPFDPLWCDPWQTG